MLKGLEIANSWINVLVYFYTPAWVLTDCNNYRNFTNILIQFIGDYCRAMAIVVEKKVKKNLKKVLMWSYHNNIYYQCKIKKRRSLVCKRQNAKLLSVWIRTLREASDWFKIRGEYYEKLKESKKRVQETSSC